LNTLNYTDFGRGVLFHRHRLSHQQIDEILNERECKKYIKEKLKMMLMVQEFLEVTELFESENLEFINLKGPLLSFRLYRDATYRQFNDLDFLMDLETVNKAIQILYNRGYKPIYFKWSKNKKRQLLIANQTNQFFLHHPKKRISIELHWRLFKNRITNDTNVNQLIKQNTTQVLFENRSFNIFNNEFELLYLIIHGGLHAWRRLKWLVDIHEFILKNNIEEYKFQQIAKKLQAKRLVSLCNKVLESYYPGTRVISAEDSYTKHLQNFSFYQINQDEEGEYNSLNEFRKYIGFKLSAFPGVRYKLSVINRLLLSIKDITNEHLPAFLFIFYLYRPVGILHRWIKAHTDAQFNFWSINTRTQHE